MELLNGEAKRERGREILVDNSTLSVYLLRLPLRCRLLGFLTECNQKKYMEYSPSGPHHHDAWK